MDLVSNVKDKLILSSNVLNKKYVAGYLIGIVVTLVLFGVFFSYYLNGSVPKHVEFFEKGNIDYKVYLEKNDFFVNKYLGKDRQYIAELIDYVIADFEYSISLDSNDVSYKYDYRVEMEANVVNKETRNVIFNNKKEVINKKDLVATDGVCIYEEIMLDYNYYNNLVKNLINTYGLLDVAESSLFVRLYVTFNCGLDDVKNASENDVVLTMQIPLAKKTVDVSLDNDVFGLDNDYFIFYGEGNYIVFLVFAVCFGILALYLIFTLIKYWIKTNSYGSMFDKKLNKILKNYGSYIQKTEGSLDFRNYKVLKIAEFESMLELRDMLSKPIMMIENEIEGIVSFVITTEDISYVYELMK